MACFEIKNLKFAYASNPSKLVLDDINLEIERGEYVAVCGKSGSGKTTLLKHLKNVLAPNGIREGQILFEGIDLNEVSLRDEASRIGYVMQNPENQIVTDKVWHELAFGLESLGTDQKVMRVRVAEMASYFGIADWFQKDVSELSGGQKQLLNLASIMAMQPEVLILDEPTSQLDPISAADFLNTVKKINLELGTTIIITEHRLEDIFHASDKVVVLDKGKIIALGTPLETAEILKENNNEMFAAMPTPVQVYYEIKEDIEKDLTCPLTVREGRTFLSEVFKDREIKFNALEDNEKEIEGEKALEVKEVWFRYEKNSDDILKGTSLQISKGEFFAIVGGNGTGKSTLLKSICRVLKPYRGKIKLEGKDISKFKDSELFKGNLSMLPQDPESIFAKKTVREELEEMLSKEDNEREEKIKTVSKICEIEDLLEIHPFDLSGGEKQRAALAKVLLNEPKILLLDEPTKGMDNFFKLKFAKTLKRLKENGITILMVSHDVEFCARYADKVGMFFDGEIITYNTSNKFFSQNSFYTTAANRMSRHVFKNAITNEDVIKLCKVNLKDK